MTLTAALKTMKLRAPRTHVSELLGAAGSAVQRLRALGLRTTAARVHIVQTFETATAPMTADDVYQSLLAHGINVGLGTSYRVLAELTTAGLLHRGWVQGHAGAKAVYSMAGTGTSRPPLVHQLTCGTCDHSQSFIDASLTDHLCLAAGLCHLDVPDKGLAITVVCLGTGPMCSKQGGPRQTVQEAASEAAPEGQGM